MNSRSTLLPAGLGDILPEESAKRRRIINTIMDCFERLGYAEVSPPLAEFENSLLAEGPGKALAANTFRMMDPMTGRMLAVRADMTAQIARIASSRMAHLPRPLKLAYCGEVLRVNPDPANPERQLTQIGAELVGASTLHHDAEVAVAALEALRLAGVETLSIDLNIPRLLDALLDGEANGDGLRHAVAMKDADAVKAIAHSHQALILALLDVPLCSPDAVAETLTGLEAPDKAGLMLADLAGLFLMIRKAAPFAQVTVDPLEQRGFDYHQGVGFAIFTPGIRGELGRGGRYAGVSDGGREELSTGVTVYLERVLRVVSAPPQAKAGS